VPQFLTCTACFQLEQPHRSAGKLQTQQSPICQDLWLGWSQRFSVTHPTKSQVHGYSYGWRLPSGAHQAELTVTLGAGLCINNADGEQSSPAWLKKICTWTDGTGATRTSPQQRILVHMVCTMQVCTDHCCCEPAFQLLPAGQDPDPPL